MLGSIVLTCALLVIGMYSVSAEPFGCCLPAYARIYYLEPGKPEEPSSKATDRGCRPAEGGETVVLTPIHPDALSAQVFMQSEL